jgi:REP element-mobilizing transposase RayT
MGIVLGGSARAAAAARPEGFTRVRSRRRDYNKGVEAMPQLQNRIPVHFTYSTKNRKPWLKDAFMRAELYVHNAAILENNVDSPAIVINGVEDHIHILCALSRQFAIKDVIKESKTETAKWIRLQGKAYADFQWQSGYGTFMVSPSDVERVTRYIAQQEQNHKRLSYQEEFREMCKLHGLAVDEQFAWD